MFTSIPFFNIMCIDTNNPNAVIGITNLGFIELRRDRTVHSPTVVSIKWRTESILGLAEGETIKPSKSHWEVKRTDGNLIFKMVGDPSIGWGVPLLVELPYDSLLNAVNGNKK